MKILVITFLKLRGDTSEGCVIQTALAISGNVWSKLTQARVIVFYLIKRTNNVSDNINHHNLFNILAIR